MAVAAVSWLLTGRAEELGSTKAGKVCACLSVVFCLAVLGWFKYAGFLSGGRLGNGFLPVGISFYIFQAVSYSVDVYKKKIRAEKNFLKYLLYLCFFPIVLSGPIERAGHLLPQFDEDHASQIRFDTVRIRDGFVRILWGLFMKMVLADRIAGMVDTVYTDPAAYGGAMTAAASVMYTLQIYCDFAGYSHIAIGIGKSLGIEICENFKAPYLAVSVADFWRRWHISLSSWLRDYVYIPLGGNRKGQVRKMANIMIVFLISGIWHGAGWTFILWGLLHGIYQVTGSQLQPVKTGIRKLLHINEQADNMSLRVFRTAVTFTLVNAAWILFRAESLSKAMLIMSRFRHPMFWQLMNGGLYSLGESAPGVRLVLLGIIIVVFVDILNERGVRISEWIADQRIWIRWPVYLFGILLVLLCGIWGPGYDAGSFIYYNF